MVMYGPIQMFVIGFPGNEFSGEIIPALKEARESGLIRIIDYLFVMKEGAKSCPCRAQILAKRT